MVKAEESEGTGSNVVDDVCVWFGLQAEPNHHNHNLAPGQIFGARLSQATIDHLGISTLILLLSLALDNRIESSS